MIRFTIEPTLCECEGKAEFPNALFWFPKAFNPCPYEDKNKKITRVVFFLHLSITALQAAKSYPMNSCSFVIRAQNHLPYN